MQIQTDRLLLRQWSDEDRLPFQAMSSDSDVMRYFPNLLSTSEADDLILRLSDEIEQLGFGVCAVECRETKEFIGCVGLHKLVDQYDFAPCIEIAWRLAKSAWGQGYATEAASASLKYAFTELGMAEVVALTARVNLPSQKVMKRLGMDFSHSFEHPAIEKESELCDHVLYTIRSYN